MGIRDEFANSLLAAVITRRGFGWTQHERQDYIAQAYELADEAITHGVRTEEEFQKKLRDVHQERPRDRRVKFCNWCPDPKNPSPEHHPDGSCRHHIKGA